MKKILDTNYIYFFCFVASWCRLASTNFFFTVILTQVTEWKHLKIRYKFIYITHFIYQSNLCQVWLCKEEISWCHPASTSYKTEKIYKCVCIIVSFFPHSFSFYSNNNCSTITRKLVLLIEYYLIMKHAWDETAWDETW